MSNHNDDIFVDPTPANAVQMTATEMQADAAGMRNIVSVDIVYSIVCTIAGDY